VFFDILAILSPRERRNALLVLVAAFVMAAIEVVGIGAVAAFIAAVADPQVIERSAWLSTLRARSGVESARDFLLLAGIGLFTVFLFRNVFGAFALSYRLHVLHGTKQAMTTRLLAHYLSQPYEYFLRMNSATVAKNITIEVNALINGCLFSWISLISDVLMCLAVMSLLAWHDPVLTVIAAAFVGCFVATIPLVTRRHLQPLGERYRALTDGLFKTTNEAIGGIKEIKVLGRESFFTRVFERTATAYARVTILYMMIMDAPRYVLEIVVVGGVLLTVLIALSTTADYASFAATVALFAVAAYRLMPLGHRMLSSVAGLQFNRAVRLASEEGLKLARAGTRLPTSAPKEVNAMRRTVTVVIERD
jgi:ABC-type multidrug transport system fused ATPase/permease subunit